VTAKATSGTIIVLIWVTIEYSLQPNMFLALYLML